MRSRHIQITISLDRVRAAAEEIRRRIPARLIAVVKADAYGLGAPPIADALAPVVHEFAYFSLPEAREVGRPGIVLGPPEGEPAEYRELSLRPAVTDREAAERFAGMPVAVKLDTGMRRFGCAADQLDELLARSRAEDVFTHAGALASAQLLREACRGRPQWLHAASTSLLNQPDAWLDGIRPGLALYRGAMRVSTRLTLVRETHGGVGYTQFECPHVGVILAGYSNHLRAGPVLINGRRQRLLEVGMNTAFVSVDPADRAGDEVVLLGDGLTEAELAAHYNCREHEILCRYGVMGVRQHMTQRETVKAPAALEADAPTSAGAPRG